MVLPTRQGSRPNVHGAKKRDACIAERRPSQPKVHCRQSSRPIVLTTAIVRPSPEPRIPITPIGGALLGRHRGNADRKRVAHGARRPDILPISAGLATLLQGNRRPDRRQATSMTEIGARRLAITSKALHVPQSEQASAQRETAAKKTLPVRPKLRPPRHPAPTVPEYKLAAITTEAPPPHRS